MFSDLSVVWIRMFKFLWLFFRVTCFLHIIAISLPVSLFFNDWSPWPFSLILLAFLVSVYN